MVEHLITSRSLEELIGIRNERISEVKELMMFASSLESKEGKRIKEIEPELERLNQLITREKRHLSGPGIVDIPEKLEFPQDDTELKFLGLILRTKRDAEGIRKRLESVQKAFARASELASLDENFQAAKKELESDVSKLRKLLSESEEILRESNASLETYRKGKAEAERKKQEKLLQEQKKKLTPLFERKKRAYEELVKGTADFANKVLKAFSEFHKIDCEYLKSEHLFSQALEMFQVKGHPDLTFQTETVLWGIEAVRSLPWRTVILLRQLIDIHNRSLPGRPIKKPEPEKEWRP